MVKFKVHRLNDWRELEKALNEFSLGEIIDYTLTMPDYRVVLLVVRYKEPEPKATYMGEPILEKKAKNDKATE